MTKVNSYLRFFTIEQQIDPEQLLLNKPLIDMLFM